MTEDEKELSLRLAEINARLQENGVEIGKRPWKALLRYSTEYKTSFRFDSEIARFIFDWYRSRYGSREMRQIALYKSVYFFDTKFWLVEIPLGYGQFQLAARDCLTDMPIPVKDSLFSSSRTGEDYAFWWADCVDYGYGISELRHNNNLNPFGHRLLCAADQELRATVTLLRENYPSSRAILTARNAVEIFLKAVLALKNCLGEDEAKKLGHNLPKIYELFTKTTGFNHWEQIKNILDIFPSVDGRYSKQIIDHKKLWDAFAFAQSIGTVIIREFTSRDTISHLLQQT